MNDWIPRALAALQSALDGERPPVEVLPPSSGDPQWVERPDAMVSADERPAVVVRTSGSTGTPKQTLLSAEALRASAEMTASVLGGHGQWLLPLHPSYVAGLAVLTRSLIADTVPVAVVADSTDPERFTAAAERLTGQRRFTSLVPTQLHRLLAAVPEGPDAGDSGGQPIAAQPTAAPAAGTAARLLSALRRFDAILLGGGAATTELIDRARALGLRVIRTYGMSETCGGCVYDGHPLPGVDIEIASDAPALSTAGPQPSPESIGTGRVRLSGPMVALGYLGDSGLTAQRFDVDPSGRRRFLTDDLGELSSIRADQAQTVADLSAAAPGLSGIPRLSITGRADDVINTGGVKVSAETVRQVLESHPSVRQAHVAGIEDAQWGHKVAAAVVLASVSRGQDTFAELDQWIRAELGAAAVPKHYELVGALPRLASGKVDRQELLRLLSASA